MENKLDLFIKDVEEGKYYIVDAFKGYCKNCYELSQITPMSEETKHFLRAYNCKESGSKDIQTYPNDTSVKISWMKNNWEYWYEFYLKGEE